MRILILGAGSMGIPTGWALSRAGHDISFYVRPGTTGRHPAEIRIEGYDRRPRRFRGADRGFHPRYLDTLESEEGLDAILVPIQHYDVPAALPLLAANAGEATIVFFGNHWDDFDLIERALGGRYVFGFPHFGGTLEGDRWYGTIPRSVSFGETDGSVTPRLTALMEASRGAGFSPRRNPRMREWHQAHFAFNCGLVTAAIRAGGLTEFARSGEHIRLALRLMREAFAVVRARGVDPDAFPGETGLAKISSVLAVLAVKLLSSTPDFRMAARHQRTGGREVKSFYYDVTREARRLGVPTPELDSLRGFVDGLPETYQAGDGGAKRAGQRRQ